MKKFFNVVLAVVLAVVFFVPGVSASAAPAAPRLSVAMDTTPYQGETTVITVSAKNSYSRSISGAWVINFPKGVYSIILLKRGNRLEKVILSKGENYNWSTIVAPGKTASVSFRVVYAKNIEGLVTALRIFEQNARNKQVGQYDVTVQVPNLTITSTSPDSPVMAGGSPVDFQFKAENSTRVAVPFDFVISMPLNGATNGNYGIVNDGHSDLTTLDGTGIDKIHWTGTVPAGKTFELKVSTFSGPNFGTFVLFGFDDLLSDVVYLDKMIVLETAPEPSLKWTSAMNATDVLAGEPVSWSMSAENSADNTKVLNFDVDIEVWFTCVQTNPDFIDPTSGEVSFPGTSDQSHTVRNWKGSVNPGETLNWGVKMVTRPYVLPMCGVVLVRDNLTGETTIFNVNVLQNNQQPYGKMSLIGADGQTAIQGEQAKLEVEMFSPVYTKFKLGQVTSPDCQIANLPGGARSVFGFTYTKFSYYVTVLPSTTGQTGLTICHLTAQMTTDDLVVKTVDIDSTFQVMFP